MPTLLYMMGLPLGRDMDGQLLIDAFESELTRSQPVTFISSYHNFLIEARRDDTTTEEPSPLDAVPDIREPPE